MNEQNRSNEIIDLSSAREEAAVSRVIKAAAEFDDSKVDYEAMLRGIKARAAEEGLVIFPAQKAQSKQSEKAKKRIGLRRVLAGVATAAAVFALGLGTLSVIKGFNNSAPSAPDIREEQQAYNDQPAESGKKGGDTVVVTAIPSSAPVSDTKSPAQPTQPQESCTAEPAPTEEPLPEETAFPTEFTMGNGLVGFIELGSFDSVPENVEDLLPELLPTFMEVADPTVTEQDEEPFAARAMGTNEEGKDYYYTCLVEETPDEELAIGVARYELSEGGQLSYLWRVTKDTCLRINLSAFEKTTADMMLSMLAVENNQRRMPAPESEKVEEGE